MSNINCPNCQTALQQLGRNEDQGDKKVWVGENLYRCRECKQGRNRFIVNDQAAPVPATAGWIN